MKHTSSNCTIFKNLQFLQAYAFIKKSQRLYTNTRYINRKLSLFCSQYFINLKICFQFRRKYNKGKILATCELAEEIFSYLHIINAYKKELKEENQQKNDVENNESTCFANHVSNKIQFRNIEVSQALKYIMNF